VILGVPIYLVGCKDQNPCLVSHQGQWLGFGGGWGFTLFVN
jgi:hypothetical protein